LKKELFIKQKSSAFGKKKKRGQFKMSLEDSTDIGFCDDQFWDNNLTWFTDNPDFTTW
jgi:hypothetical protein